MSLMQLRHWPRTYRREKIRWRAWNNLLWTSYRLMAIGLVGVAFLFYRLDMPGIHTYFTGNAPLGSTIMQMGFWEDEEYEVIVEYSNGDRFHTEANNDVTFKIEVDNVNTNTVKLLYQGEEAPGPHICEYRDGILEVTFQNRLNEDPPGKYFGNFFQQRVEGNKEQVVEVTLVWELNDGTPCSATCEVVLFIPPGQQITANVSFSTDEERLIAEISFQGNPKPKDIHLDSLFLVYENNILELVPEDGGTKGNTRTVYFDRSEVDNWLKGLGVQAGIITLTVGGDVDTNEGLSPFSASSEYLFDPPETMFQEELLEGLLPGAGEGLMMDGGGMPGEGEQPPAEGEEPPAEGGPENEDEPGEEPPEDGEEPGDDGGGDDTGDQDGDDDGGADDTGDQDGDDDDEQDPSGGEEALPREDDDNSGDQGGDEGEDGDDPEPDPEEEGGSAETGAPGQEGDEPGGDEEAPGGEVGAGGGQSEAGQGGSEPAGPGDAGDPDAQGDEGDEGGEL
jgi:hypothetical protein